MSGYYGSNTVIDTSLGLYVTLRNMYFTHMLLMRNLGLREVVWVLQVHTATIHTI